MPTPGTFDTAALFAAVDERLAARGMTLPQLVRQLAWMNKDTLDGMRARNEAGCHHVLPVIQWLGRTPESFTVRGDDFEGALLPDPAPGRWRWYWDMTEIRTALDNRRTARGLTWSQVAAELGTVPAEVTFLRKTKYGVSMSLAMRSARWLDRTATSFMWEHDGLGLPWSGRRVDAHPK